MQQKHILGISKYALQNLHAIILPKFYMTQIFC
jgi:hypothetical protein